MSGNLQKKPSKGILKNSRSLDKSKGAPSTSKRPKEQKFDEKNIRETYHPPNKDYGHMKIDEPPTPYGERVDNQLMTGDELDANMLAAKLAASMNKPPKCMTPSSSDSESEGAKLKRKNFEKKRKGHYNEFQALKLARQLMEQDDDTDDDSKGTDKPKPKPPPPKPGDKKK